MPQIPQTDTDSQPFQALMKLEKQREKEAEGKGEKVESWSTSKDDYTRENGYE